MDVDLFENTLKYAQKKFHIVPLNELLFNSQVYSTKPLVAITFDDGYHDFLDYSLPLLQKFNIPSTLFVVTDCIQNNTPTWTYTIDFLFEHTNKLQIIDCSFSDLPLEFRDTAWNNNFERMNYGKKIKQYLKWIPAPKRKEILNVFKNNFNDVEIPGGLMLTWNELKKIKESGVEIGSHSVSHSTLASIEDELELKQELEASAYLLKEKLGTISPVFSYPCGSYNEKVKSFTRNAGYKAGLAVNGNLYNSSRDDLFEVPRIELYNQSWLRTKMRMNGAISFMKKELKN